MSWVFLSHWYLILPQMPHISQVSWLQGHFKKNDNIPIPHTLLNATVPSLNEHFILSFFWYTPTKAVYIISNKGPQHLGWQLALMNVTTALECMHRKDVNMGELLSFLVQSGRAFMTHRCHSQIPLPVYHYPSPIIQSSFRSLSRLPTVHDDYTYYEVTQWNFLSQP